KGDPPVTEIVDTTFPKGVALADWLMATKASTTYGQISAAAVENSIDGVNAPALQWLHTTTPKATTANQCGRVTFTDVHVAEGATSSDVSHPDIPFPMGCLPTTSMTAPELA